MVAADARVAAAIAAARRMAEEAQRVADEAEAEKQQLPLELAKYEASVAEKIQEVEAEVDSGSRRPMVDFGGATDGGATDGASIDGASIDLSRRTHAKV